MQYWLKEVSTPGIAYGIMLPSSDQVYAFSARGTRWKPLQRTSEMNIQICRYAAYVRSSWERPTQDPPVPLQLGQSTSEYDSSIKMRKLVKERKLSPGGERVP